SEYKRGLFSIYPKEHKRAEGTNTGDWSWIRGHTKRGAQVVGYADLLGGRVTLSQESSGVTVIYGQFNTGFGASSNPADYTFVFEPSGVVIKPSYSILNGGTSAWILNRNDVRLSHCSGTDISKDKLVVKRGATVIGSAPVTIV
ncbi:11020_t:CDS:1, partial [Ambispora gerdemannii]